ncbi:MAG: hypothetical protein M1820_006479 [Bogoriella megaspora]|nr:MAG: hypothetical protein M1820_006479 [Bogoriella megaspora]
MPTLQQDYPWTISPLIVGAPMRLIATPPLAVEVSRAGGIGFLAGGTDLSTLQSQLHETHSLLSSSPSIPPSRPNHLPPNPEASADILPIGIGIITWGASLPALLSTLQRPPYPAALWLFAPNHISDLQSWTEATRKATKSRTKIWIQIGSVRDAESVVRLCNPDVLVIQGVDAGGHGLTRGAGLTSLLPECIDTVTKICHEEKLQLPAFVAAGGIMDGRGVASAFALGAQGAVLGTRLLASPEADITRGYREAVLRARDGGQTTMRTGLYDALRGTTGWPGSYGGRGVLNRSWEDAERGMGVEENKRLYEEMVERSGRDEGEEGWREGTGRLTTYAGTGVGLVKEVMPAREIVEEVREGARAVMKRLGSAKL